MRKSQTGILRLNWDKVRFRIRIRNCYSRMRKRNGSKKIMILKLKIKRLKSISDSIR